MPQPQREVTLSFMAEPTAANFSGNVHGGSVMKWLDHAGYACAVGWSQNYCVTANVGGISFLRPIHVGHLVRVNAKVVHTGRTSMHVLLEVSSADPRSMDFRSTTRCIMIFVAVDENRNPTQVPTWVAESDLDKKLEECSVRLSSARQDPIAELYKAIDEHAD